MGGGARAREGIVGVPYGRVQQHQQHRHQHQHLEDSKPIAVTKTGHQLILTSTGDNNPSHDQMAIPLQQSLAEISRWCTAHVTCDMRQLITLTACKGAR